MFYNSMKLHLFILLFVIFIMIYFFLQNNETFTSINLDDIQRNLNQIKLVGDDVYNSYIDKIYNNYFENNDNDTDHYLDGSFPTYGRYTITNKKKKKKKIINVFPNPYT